MAETASLARPYVRAIFEIARKDGDLSAWSEQLAVLKAVATDPQVTALDGDPRIDRSQMAQLVIDVSGDKLSDAARNLVRLLAENRRLSVIDEIATQYEVLRADAENTVEAEIESATEMSQEHQDRLAEALSKRLDRSVKLHCTTRPELLGGAVIRTGDFVYDGSVRAQLEKMSAALNA
ncbi:MAG: ATP synthase subunit delta [marine bacterium B5-7]|nr:MAG: ATP synthase subunit delta [marine bacterium B5-7]